MASTKSRYTSVVVYVEKRDAKFVKKESLKMKEYLNKRTFG